MIGDGDKPPDSEPNANAARESGAARDKESTDANVSASADYVKRKGFVALWRSPELFEMLTKKRYHNAFLLLSLIATRARYSGSSSLNGLQVGQALVGDFKSCGLSRKEYRVALKFLATRQFVATKATNKGTIATLLDNPIYQYEFNGNGQQKGHQGATKGPPEGHQGATNNKENKETKKQGNNVASSEVDSDFIAQQQILFPHLNVEQEEGKAKAWISARPGRKFTRRFFVGWLNRAKPEPAVGKKEEW